jgi:hypothetical protein
VVLGFLVEPLEAEELIYAAELAELAELGDLPGSRPIEELDAWIPHLLSRFRHADPLLCSLFSLVISGACARALPLLARV